MAREPGSWPTEPSAEARRTSIEGVPGWERGRRWAAGSSLLRLLGRFAVALYRFIDGVEVAEEREEPRYDEERLDAVGGVGQAEVAAGVAHRGQPADEHAEARGVHEADLVQVHDDVLMACFLQLAKPVVELGAIGSAHQVALQVEDDGAVVFGLFESHGRGGWVTGKSPLLPFGREEEAR